MIQENRYRNSYNQNKFVMQFLQEQQPHDILFLKNCFLINTEPQNVSPMELLFIQSEQDQHEQGRQTENSVDLVQQEPVTQRSLYQIIQEPGRDEEICSDSKRRSKPSNHNQTMGFIPQSAQMPKKIYRRKKRLQNSEKLQNQYPTKNFLQNFKGAHFQYLKARLPLSLLKSNQVYERIRKKSGISMQDYSQLYSVPQFEKTFNQMFRSKHLYRAMMLSRSVNISRIHHLRKISLFEQSFRTKVFKCIN